MNELQFQRLLRTLINELRALRQEIHTIHSDQQAHNNEPVKSLQVEIAATSQLDRARQEYYQSENRERHSLWAKLKPWLEGIGVFIALALVVLTFGTLKQVQRQADIAEVENRPWLKIVDVKLDTAAPDIPMLSFMSLGTVKQPVTMAIIRLEFLVKNIGKGVANDVLITPAVIFAQWNDPKPDRIAKEEDRHCGYYLKSKFSEPFAWSAVFPGDEVKFRVSVAGAYAENLVSHVPGKPGNYLTGALYGCVTYQYPRGYQTRAVFDILGEQDRFLEVGKPLDAMQVRLIRDEHYERAQ